MFCPLCLSAQTRFRFRIKGAIIRECVACLALFTPSLMPASARRPFESPSAGAVSEPCGHQAEAGYAFSDAQAMETASVKKAISHAPTPKGYGGSYLARESAEAETLCGYYDYESEKALHERNYRKLFEFIGENTRGRSLLDIGCASGHFLAAAQDKGFNVMGIDIAREAIERLKKERGIEGIAGDILILEPHRRFDFITLVETIEHFPDPNRALGRIVRWLKPGGRLIVVTGDCRAPMARWMGRFWWYLIPPDHIVYYNPRALELLFARHGLVLDRWARQYSHWVSSRNAAMKTARTLNMGAQRGLALARRAPNFPLKIFHGTTFLASFSYPE